MNYVKVGMVAIDLATAVVYSTSLELFHYNVPVRFLAAAILLFRPNNFPPMVLQHYYHNITYIATSIATFLQKFPCTWRRFLNHRQASCEVHLLVWKTRSTAVSGSLTRPMWVPPLSLSYSGGVRM